MNALESLERYQIQQLLKCRASQLRLPLHLALSISPLYLLIPQHLHKMKWDRKTLLSVLLFLHMQIVYKVDNLYIQTSKLLGNQKPPQLVEVECRMWQSIFRIAENQADVASEMCDFSSWITSREDDLRRDEGKTWFKLAEVSTAVHMSLTCADVVGPLPLGWAIPDLLQHENQNLVEEENEHSGYDQSPTQDRGDEVMNEAQGGNEGGRRDQVMGEAQGGDEGGRGDQVMDEAQDGDEGGRRDQVMDKAQGGDEGGRREPDGEDDEDMNKESEAQDGEEPHHIQINRAHVANSQSSHEGARREPEEDDEHMETEENNPLCMEDSINPENSPLRTSLRQKSMSQSSSTSTAHPFLKSMASARHRSTASKKNKKTQEAIHLVSVADWAGSAVEHPIDVDLLFV